MSARDKIMAIAFTDTYTGKAQAMREAMDAYAHELAEKQRAVVKDHEERGFASDLTPSKLIAVIDPEVSS